VHEREVGRDHVRARDLRGVARLAERADEEAARHALERAERHDVARPLHPGGRERHRVGRVGVDVAVPLHPHERQRHGAVDECDGGHGRDEAQRHVAAGVLGLLCHGGHHVEPRVGPVHDGRGAEDARGAEGEEGRREVGGLEVGEPRGQDEGDDGDADHGRDRVDGGGEARAGDRERGGGAEDDDGDRVQQIESVGERGHVDAERVAVAADERREVRRPGPAQASGAHHGLEQDVPRGDERGQVPKLDAQVREGAAGGRDLGGELGVAEGREQRGEARGGVGKRDGRAGVEARLLAGEHEDARADDGAEPEEGEIHPGEAPAERVLALGEQRPRLDGLG